MIRFINRFLATGFFIGNIPGAPGTYGSILTIALLSLFPWLTTWWGVIIIFFSGVLISGYEEKVTGIDDEPSIVFDEICGMLITFMGISIFNISSSWPLIIAGFILFRFFDIIKPFPIKQVQKLSHGWGVMFDDLLAGIAANFILRIINYLI